MSAREKLATWRGQLTDALNTSLDGGSLPLIAAVHTAIAAIETEEQLAAATNSASLGDRVAISDDGITPIQLVAFLMGLGVGCSGSSRPHL
jgi:hypothetical protein